MKYIKLIFLSIIIMTVIWILATSFLDTTKENQQKLKFMEMIQRLSLLQNKLEICLSKNKDLSYCDELTNFLKEESINKKLLYFSNDEETIYSIYGIDFQNKIILNMQYNKDSLQRKCLGWPKNVLVTKCELLTDLTIE